MMKELKQYYLGRGMTQEELGKMLGVTFLTVNRWLNGKNKPAPQQEYLIKKLIAPTMSLSVEEDKSKYGAMSSSVKHYGDDEDCVINIKLIKDFGGTQKEELIIKYVDKRRFNYEITIPGKDFVDLLEKYRKDKGI